MACVRGRRCLGRRRARRRRRQRARRARPRAHWPGASRTRSGCRTCASISRPSTSRGPGREKVAEASIATMRRAPRAAQLVGVGVRLLQRAVGVVPARHHDDDLGAGGGDAPPSRAAEGSPGRPSTSTPPAISISCGSSGRRRTPGRATRARRRGTRRRRATASRTASTRARWRATSSSAASRRAGRLRDRPDVAQRLAERLGVQRDHLRAASAAAAADLRHLVVGDRADRAQLLRDDQVGRELGERLLVERVDRLAARGALAHGGVDLARRSGPARQHVARQWGSSAASGG